MSEPQSREYTVIALREQQLWAEDARGDIIRAWKTEHAGVRHGALVRVYCDQSSEIIGWHDPESGEAVDQRGFDAGARGEPRSLACLGSCGIVWTAPGGEAALASGSGCPNCGGPRREV